MNNIENANPTIPYNKPTTITPPLKSISKSNLSKKAQEAQAIIEKAGITREGMREKIRLHKALKNKKQGIEKPPIKKTETEIWDDLFSFVFEMAEDQEIEINELKKQLKGKEIEINELKKQLKNQT